MPLRLIFMGTPDFAVPTLLELVAHGHEVAAVYTRAPKPAGRGMKLQATPVEQEARRLGIPVLTPSTLKTPESLQEFTAHNADAAVVVAYGMILPKAILDAPKGGCFNLHASLLPRWRGAAPIARAVEAGDATSGITVMKMDAGLDTGPVVAQRAVALDARETAGSLHDKLAALGAAMIVEALDALARSGTLCSTPQPQAGVTYAAKITAADTLLDWTRDAVSLDRRVRALSPHPGAVARWNGAALKIRGAQARDEPSSAPPGTVVAVAPSGIDVACGRGVLRVSEVQPAGGRAMPAHAFAVGHRVVVGARLGNGR